MFDTIHRVAEDRVGERPHSSATNPGVDLRGEFRDEFRDEFRSELREELRQEIWADLLEPEFGDIELGDIAVGGLKDGANSQSGDRPKDFRAGGGAAALPAGLDDMEPGPFLAAVLSGIDHRQLSGYDRIVLLRAHQRMASHYSAGVYRSMAAVTEHMRRDEDYDNEYLLATESAAAEIRVALRLTRRATETEHVFALELHERLPRVLTALAAGAIDVRRAKTIAHHTYHLSAASARSVVDAVIEQAPRLTTGQLAARVKKLCIETNPDEAADRYRSAVEERRLVAAPNVDGTASLIGRGLPPERVTAAMRYINRLARSLRGGGEARTMDQLRTDIYLDLINGTAKDVASSANSRTAKRNRTAGGRGVVDMHVDLETLLRLNDSPGELAGYGPVIADVARQVVEDQAAAEWRFTVTDPASGRPILNGTTRRRPTVAQRRHVEARNRTCIFPGCRMPATGSDIDHRVPYSEGGLTRTSQLAPACRHDHCIRHQHGWTYEPISNGDFLWTTKLGHRYTTSGAPP